MIQLLRYADNGWYMTEHRVTHNHVLTETCGETAFWPSHRHIDMFTKDLVKQLRDNNIIFFVCLFRLLTTYTMW
jgi:hypothetical protein